MFVGRCVTGLPRLAWVATLRRDDPTVQLLHGDTVETPGTGFVAGAWDGPYDGVGALDAPVMMGSAGGPTAAGVKFAGASHPFDHLYCLRDDAQLHVSNSLPLLFAHSGDGPDPRYRRYRADQIALQLGGTTASPMRFPTRSGREVHMHLATDLTVGDDLTVTAAEKPTIPAFHGFDEYRAMLVGALERLVDNAADPNRRHPLRTLSTISNGYDSAVCAVLGAEAGIRDALTLVPSSSDEDSGEAIGARIGLNVIVRTPDAWQQQPGEPEIEFAASTSGPPKLPLATLDDGWRDSIVLLGSLGDELWVPEEGDFTDHNAQTGAVVFSAESLHDFGLRAGVVFVHVPTIGSDQFREIRRITESDEMAPWSIGERYNRPIPRRIIEGAGIARGSFALRKHATAVMAPGEMLRPAARADFKRFWRATCRQQPLVRRPRYHLESRVVAPATWWAASALWKLPRVRGVRLGKRARRRMRAWSYHRALPTAYEFHWAIGRLTDSCAAALRSAPDSRAPEPADSL